MIWASEVGLHLHAVCAVVEKGSMLAHLMEKGTPKKTARRNIRAGRD